MSFHLLGVAEFLGVLLMQAFYQGPLCSPVVDLEYFGLLRILRYFRYLKTPDHAAQFKEEHCSLTGGSSLFIYAVIVH